MKMEKLIFHFISLLPLPTPFPTSPPIHSSNNRETVQFLVKQLLSGVKDSFSIEELMDGEPDLVEKCRVRAIQGTFSYIFFPWCDVFVSLPLPNMVTSLIQIHPRPPIAELQ